MTGGGNAPATALRQEQWTIRRIIVALNEPERIGDFITCAQHVATYIAYDSLSFSPRPPLAVLALDAAQLATVLRAPPFT